MRFHFDADLDRNFHSDADPDPAPHESDNESATDGQQSFQYSIVTLCSSVLGLHSSWILTLMRIRILLFTLMRIRLHKTMRVHSSMQIHISKTGKNSFRYVFCVHEGWELVTWEERVWKMARNSGFPSSMYGNYFSMTQAHQALLSPPPPTHTHTGNYQTPHHRHKCWPRWFIPDLYRTVPVPLKSFCIRVLTVPWRPIFFLRGILAFLEFLVSLQLPGVATFLVFMATLKNVEKC
jgi:hypothetical protein